MDRLSTLAAHQRSLNTLFALQKRASDAEWQMASGKRSQTYQGLGRDAAPLLDLKNARIAFDRLAKTNEAVLSRMKVSEVTLNSIDKTMRDVREVLMTTGGHSPLEAADVKELQEAAFRALSDLEAFLNTQVDGRYLFSGSRVVTKPVDLGLSDLSAFQARYDGLKTHYPPTREAHLSAALQLTTAETGGLRVDTQVVGDTTISTISALDTLKVPSPFEQIAIGATVTLAGSSLGNDGSYTVVAKPSPYELVVSGPLTLGSATLDVQAVLNPGDEDAAATLSLSRWYQGDERTTTHRVDEQRYETFDLTAIDPAFEKAIRAFALIAQGAPDTDGGLANHPERIAFAIDLLNHALERAPGMPPPFGDEQPSNLDEVRRTLGYQEALLNDTAVRQNEFVATLEMRISALEDIDPNVAAANLLDASAALEAAYTAIAEVRRLSLVDFL
jgi:flagellin-like hook-associated protein FlgL